MLKLAIAIIAVAVVATAGDYVWYEFGVRHRMAIGILHGAVLLMAAGAALGWPVRRTIAGLTIGMGAGILSALIYYALAPAAGKTALPVAWAAVWLLLAVGMGRLARSPRPWSTTIASGVAAAVLSGLSFYLVSGIVWGRAPAGGRSYLLQFACWLVAWAPGLLAIGWRSGTTG